MDTLDALAAAIPPLDDTAMDAAHRRQNRLTKPPGSLGRLEEIAVAVAGMTGVARPSLARAAVVVAAADHGVAARGVSAYPREVTRQMVANFLAGGAAISALARNAGARVIVADFGVAGEGIAHPDLVDARQGEGTADFLDGPAMSVEIALAAIAAGAAIVERERVAGLDVICTGEMGIGNTTSAAALTAAFTGAPPEAVTGHGTGVEGAAFAHKVRVVEMALTRHLEAGLAPIEVLARLGGFEIAGLAGVILAAAANRVPVVLDGYITTAAALAAVAIAPGAREYLIASHRSVEPGHRTALTALGLDPLLDFRLRLGEGSGAALALPLLRAATAVHNEMATFEEAGVSET